MFIKKNLHLSGPMQFQPLLFKAQMYELQPSEQADFPSLLKM